MLGRHWNRLQGTTSEFKEEGREEGREGEGGRGGKERGREGREGEREGGEGRREGGRGGKKGGRRGRGKGNLSESLPQLAFIHLDMATLTHMSESVMATLTVLSGASSCSAPQSICKYRESFHCTNSAAICCDNLH
jgi:hypothetical protein